MTQWADWIRGKESTETTQDQDSKNYISIKSGMTVNGNMRHSRGTIASSNFSSGTAGYSLDAATGNIETNSDLVCGNIHVKAATDDVNLSGATGNAIIGVSTSAQHLAFDANEIMSKSDATTAGTLYLQHNGGTLAVGAGAVGTFRVGSNDGTTHKSVASFSHGAHGTPSITFNSDLDTGFFRESSNTIGSTGNFTMSKDGSSATLTVSTFADAPGTESIIVLRSADNTLASPQLRDSGDNLGEIHFSGHDGTDYAVGAKISVAASATTGSDDMGATIKLQTTPDNSQTPTTRLAIDHVGRAFLTAASTDSVVDLDAVSGDLLVGTVDGGDQHIAMSDQVIQVKTDGTTAGNLFVQNSGGNLTLGASASAVTLNGTVTQPNIPAFMVHNTDTTGGTAGGLSGSGAAVWPCGTERFDNGNNFNTTTGYFYAPVDGYYFLSFTIFMYTSYDNDSNTYFGIYTSNGHIIINHGTKGEDGGHGVSGLFYLDQGDGAAPYKWSGTSFDMTTWRTESYNQFSGALIG